MEMKYDVFISYRREDIEHANAACDALESAGLRCWIAPRNIEPAEVWPDEIIEGVKRSQLVLVILSSHTNNNSKHIKRELNQADEQKLPVIAFRVEKVEPANGLDFYLDTVQWLDAFPRPSEKHLQLIEKVKQLLGVPPSPQPTTPTPRTPRWWIVASGGLLAALAIFGIFAMLNRAEVTTGTENNTNTVVVNTNLTLAPSPTVTPISSPVPPTPGISPAPPTPDNHVLPGNVITLPPPAVDAIRPLIAELFRNDSTESDRYLAITRLEPLAGKDLPTHRQVISEITRFIRERAARKGKCSMRASRTLPADLQEALRVIARRKWWYGNGETEPLELSNTDLSGAMFFVEGGKAHFEGVRLKRACLDNALLEGGYFQCAYLSEASVTEFGVGDTNFCHADLSHLTVAKGPSPESLLTVALNVNAAGCTYNCPGK